MIDISLSNSPFALIIFIATVAISLLCFRNKNLLQKLMFTPYQVVHNNKWYQIVSSGFIHNDLYHLFFNMLSFYFFAFELERSIGSYKFIVIYIGSMILSHLPTLYKHKDNFYYRSLGASGAISGIVFSSILVFPTNKIMIMPIPIPLPSAVFGLAYLIWCKIAATRAHDNINHDAHFAGAIAGVLITFFLLGAEILNIWKNLF